MSAAPNKIPPEVTFDRYFSGHPSPSHRRKYAGRPRSIDFTDAILGDAIEGIRDAINERFRVNASAITSPHGEPIIHMDYVKSDEVSAFSFFHEGIAFIALTTALIARLIDITSKLWRLNPLGDLFKVNLSNEARNHIGATSLPIQIQIVSSHELGHFFHGHCGESNHPGLRVDEAAGSSVRSEGQADQMRNQAMEVEADGYAAHMMLTNFFNGVGENLYRMLNPSLPKEEFILTYFMVELGSLFYLWGPRVFDPRSVRSYDHPPALMRLNVFMRDIQGWCNEHQPRLEHWGTLERFQRIMHCVSLANEDTNGFKVWQEQGAFLRSEGGERYIADLYKTRETLRAEMDHLRWYIRPASRNVARCLVCGSSEQEGGEWAGCLKCAKCGAAMGLRSERCWLSDETINKLLPHTKTLESFGFQIKSGDRLEKHWADQVGGVAAAVYIVETVRPGTVQDIIQFLKRIHIPYEEILRLRLDEPDNVKELYKKDDAVR